MHHVDDTDDVTRARRLNRIVQGLPLADADKRVLSAGLVAFIESYHAGMRAIIHQESAPIDSGFAALGAHAHGLR